MHAISERAARVGAAAYYGGLRTLRVPAVRRWLHDAGVILCYHNVVATEQDRLGSADLHIAYPRFERQMHWLTDHYDVVPLRDFMTRRTEGRSLRNTAVITFDDGYDGVFRHAVPLLEDLGLPATIFVVADAPGRSTGFWWDHFEDGAGDVPVEHRPADWDAIRARLGGGIEIGVHTVSHPSLPTLADADLEHEIVDSRTLIHQATGIWPDTFAYPYGHWNPRIRAAVKAAGYRAAVTTDVGLNDSRTDAWSLRRINVPADIRDSAFEAWTSGLFGHRRRG